jgi:uncharacterized small protein (TIGR04563 family)
VPTYLTRVRLDWGWADRSATERALIARHDRDLDDHDHTALTFARDLGAASAALPGVDVAAVVEDQGRSRTLLLARDGAVRTIYVKDATVRGPWDALPDHDLDGASIRCGARNDEVAAALAEATGDEIDREDGEDGVEELIVPPEYPSLDALRAAMDVVAGAMEGPPCTFVAEVEGERHLVSLAPGRATIEHVFPWPSSDDAAHATLIARLLADDGSGRPPALPYGNPARVPHPATETIAQTLYVPSAVLADLGAEARRLDKSHSYLVQLAWVRARQRIAEIRDHDAARAQLDGRLGGSPPARESVYLPGALLNELEAEAGRFDSSLSFVVLLAWSLARSEIAAMGQPEPDGPPPAPPPHRSVGERLRGWLTKRR